MNNSSNLSSPVTARIVRWIARILCALIVLFWGFFIVAHLLGGGEEASRPLDTSDYVGLITIGVWLAGLAVAWKWELIGGLIALLAFAIAAVNNPKVLSFPIVMVPITAVLFLGSWWMHRQCRKEPPEVDTTT